MAASIPRTDDSFNTLHHIYNLWRCGAAKSLVDPMPDEFTTRVWCEGDKITNIIIKAVSLAILLAVISLTFSMMTLFITSINDIVYGMPSGDPMKVMEEFNASTEEELNRKVHNATENILMVKNKSSQTMKILDGINAVVLGAGADALSAMGQEGIAQVVRKQSVKLKIRTEMLEYASHFNETGYVKEGQKDAVEEDFEDLQNLLGYYEELENETGKSPLEQMGELKEPME